MNFRNEEVGVIARLLFFTPVPGSLLNQKGVGRGEESKVFLFFFFTAPLGVLPRNVDTP